MNSDQAGHEGVMAPTTYRLTIRPAVPEHVPPGYLGLVPSTEAARFDHGTVTYAEPLPRAVADHWSLQPVGPRVASLRVDGMDLPLSGVLGGDHEDVAYRLATGQLSVAEVRERIVAVCADYEVELEALTFDEEA